MVSLRRPFAGLLLALSLLAVPTRAQIPSAPPGTICVTTQGWCRAVQPGPPGGPCACHTPSGWVQGVLR